MAKNAVAKEEVEVLSPEVEEIIDAEIETSLVKQNVTETILARLEKEYVGLTINGQADKEGFLTVQAARKDCWRLEVLIGKICKAGRAKANAEADKWIKKEKDLKARVKKVKDALEADETAWEADRDAKKAQEALKLKQQGIQRTSHMLGFGAVLEAGNWVLDDISYESVMVEGVDTDIYQGIYDQYKAKFDEKEKRRLAEIEDQEQARIALKNQREELVRQQQEARKERAESRIAIMVSQGMKLMDSGTGWAYKEIVIRRDQVEELLSDDWHSILNRTTEAIAESKKKEEENKRRNESFKSRMADLKGWTFNGFTVGRPIDLDGGLDIFGSMDDLLKLGEEEFASLVSKNNISLSNLEERKGEKAKKDLENARLEGVGRTRREMFKAINAESAMSDKELGEVSDEQWTSDFGMARKMYDQRQKELADKAEKERQELMGEKQKYEELIAYLKATKFPAFKSGQYRAKANIIRDFIDGLK